MNDTFCYDTYIHNGWNSFNMIGIVFEGSLNQWAWLSFQMLKLWSVLGRGQEVWGLGSDWDSDWRQKQRLREEEEKRTSCSLSQEPLGQPMLENRKEISNCTASNPQNHARSKSHHSSSPSSTSIENSKEKGCQEQNTSEVKNRSKATTEWNRNFRFWSRGYLYLYELGNSGNNFCNRLEILAVITRFGNPMIM